MTDHASAEEVLAQMVRLLVRHPDRVTCTTSSNSGGKTIHIGVDKQDLGCVVGKTGQTARSIRIILAAMSARAGSRIMIDIVENNSPAAQTDQKSDASSPA